MRLFKKPKMVVGYTAMANGTSMVGTGSSGQTDHNHFNKVFAQELTFNGFTVAHIKGHTEVVLYHTDGQNTLRIDIDDVK